MRKACFFHVTNIRRLIVNQVTEEDVLVGFQANALWYWKIQGLLSDRSQHLVVGEVLSQTHRPVLSVHTDVFFSNLGIFAVLPGVGRSFDD